MLGFGKDNAAIEAFAHTLVADLVKRFPPEKQTLLGGTKLKPAAQLGKAVTGLERKVAAFQQEHQLGVYGKAKLLNSIKWQMKELQYTEDFVAATTTSLAQLLGTR
jgi:hypothetical protein